MERVYHYNLSKFNAVLPVEGYGQCQAQRYYRRCKFVGDLADGVCQFHYEAVLRVDGTAVPAGLYAP
jgi:hypothetical protein